MHDKGRRYMHLIEDTHLLLSIHYSWTIADSSCVLVSTRGAMSPVKKGGGTNKSNAMHWTKWAWKWSDYPWLPCQSFMSKYSTEIVMSNWFSQSANGPWDKSFNFISPTRHVIPESLSRLAIGWVSSTCVSSSTFKELPCPGAKLNLQMPGWIHDMQCVCVNKTTSTSRETRN